MNHIYNPDELTLPMPVPAKRRRSGMRRKTSRSNSHENTETKTSRKAMSPSLMHNHRDCSLMVDEDAVSSGLPQLKSAKKQAVLPP